jgi:hypothetical protein
MTPVAIVTGASAGIGAELARVFARRGHAVVLVARREDRLKSLASEIEAAGWPRAFPLAVDLGRSDAVTRIGKALAARGLEPQFVVNNAGFGLIGPAAEIDRNEQLAMIDLNIRLLTDLSLAFVDDLARNRGGVLNVASVAGFLPGPGMAVYGVLREQSLCIVVYRGAASRASCSRRARELPLSGAGRDRILRACRIDRWRLAGHSHRQRRARRRGRLPRSDAQQARCGARLRQQARDPAHPNHAARMAA